MTYMGEVTPYDVLFVYDGNFYMLGMQSHAAVNSKGQNPIADGLAIASHPIAGLQVGGLGQEWEEGPSWCLWRPVDPRPLILGRYGQVLGDLYREMHVHVWS